MMDVLKTKFVNINNFVIPEIIKGDKRKIHIYLVAFYCMIASIFLTIIGQLPMFTARSLTQLFQVGWVITIIPLIMLDYKRFLRLLGVSLCLITPFIIYCIIALIFKINSFGYGGTTYIFLSLYLFIVGMMFSKYKTNTTIKMICFSFVIPAIIYAGVVYITKLRGYDIENQIYAFGDKNSAGPIFMSAAILSFYIFNKKKPLSIIIRWLIAIYFTLIIILSKNRAILLICPLILLMLLVIEIKSIKISLIVILAAIGIVSLFFIIPYLRENIIIKILFNNKTNIDDIFSGRITQIVTNFQVFKPILGSGSSYFDVMPLSFLCTYGIIGVISLMPFLISPFYILFKYFRKGSDRRLGDIFFVLAITFLISSLFEGFGYIGTGAKVFILWILAGNFSIDTTTSLSQKHIFSKIGNFGCFLSKLSTNTFIFIIQGLLALSSIVFIVSPSIVSYLGKYIVERLPTTNIIAPYVEVKDIQINPPVSSMCVGQRITYGLSADPINAEDCTVQWSDGWVHNGVMSVNEYTGEVTAHKTGTFLLHINRYMVGPNGVYIQQAVTAVEDYSFDKMHIATRQYEKSFQYVKDEIIDLNKNHTLKLYYDDYYLPDESLIEFVSSNNNVATIENNVVRAVSNGTCEISAKVSDKNNNISVNKIVINVNDMEEFVPVTSLSFDSSTPIYQHESFALKPIFNEHASDKNYDLSISGLKYELLNDQITFKEYGKATITITSLNNPLVKYTQEVDVIENHPVKFGCNENWMKIGEVKTTKDLGLYIEYSSGHKRIVTEKDIVIEARDMTNRACSNRNGFVKNRTTIKAVKKGSISFSYTSIIDNNIKGTFKITSSVYSKSEYNKIVNGVGTIVVSIFACITLLFTLFVVLRIRMILYISIPLFIAIFIIILSLLYGFNLYFITGLVLLIISGIIPIILIAIKKAPFKLLEEPVED